MAVGDIVGMMVAVGGAATSFVLINNPGGFFAVSGSNLIQAIDAPIGVYPVTIKAVGPNYLAITSFSFVHTANEIEIILDTAPGWTIVG